MDLVSKYLISKLIERGIEEEGKTFTTLVLCILKNHVFLKYRRMTSTNVEITFEPI